MGLRNKLFRKIKSSLIEDGLSETEAMQLARKTVEDRQESLAVAYPAGQSGSDNAGESKGLSKVPGTHLRNDICSTKKNSEITCIDDTPYRQIDGKCNNLQKPLYGVASTPFIRATLKSKPIKATWQSKPIKQNLEKLSAERPCFPREKSQPPEFLPSARLVSTTIHKDTDISDQSLTHMVTQMAQFIDHDITLTTEEETPQDCCKYKNDDNCFTIKIPLDDPFYSTRKTAVTCLSFHTSTKFCEQNKDIAGR